MVEAGHGQIAGHFPLQQEISRLHIGMEAVCETWQGLIAGHIGAHRVVLVP